MTTAGRRERLPEPPGVRLATIARRQHGVVTRAQALRAGFAGATINDRLADGRWTRLHPGVYALPAAPATWRRSLMAACLALGPNAMASHRAAARLWRLPGFTGEQLEVLTPRGAARAPGTGVVVHRSRSLPAADRAVVDEIPVTTAARTLIDLAGVVPVPALEEALDQALHLRLVTIRRLRWRLTALSRRGRSGVTVLAQLIEARAGTPPVPQSVLETKVLRSLLDAGLPMPAVQREIRVGEQIYVVDFAYPDLRIAIEADGYRWHGGQARWQRDLARRNALTSLGWQVVHLTWHRLDETIPVIASLLQARV